MSRGNPEMQPGGWLGAGGWRPGASQGRGLGALMFRTVTVLAQLCFNIVFYYSMLLWNDCSYLATKLLKSELQMHRETPCPPARVSVALSAL